MSSGDHVHIDMTLVRRLVAGQFPRWADLPVAPVEPGGWDNRTFRLGEGMSVRLPSAARYAAQVEKEQAWLPRLAPRLPLSVPVPLAMGAPASGYPWPWSVYRWLEGETATVERLDDPCRFATALAGFLVALQQVDPAGGPPPGTHNFFRGGPPATYDAETRRALAALRGEVDTVAAARVWETALEATWHDRAVWLHGDVEASNLLVRGGRLSAVIDFGCAAVGDPACDLTIAWTLFTGASREAFRAALPADEGAWARARGWALWKALIVLAEHVGTDPRRAREARRTIGEVLGDGARPAAGRRPVGEPYNARMSPSGTIDRKAVTDRRRLSFRTMQDIAGDVNGLGEDPDGIRVSGNWSAAQILGHVTFFMDGALDGIDVRPPLHFRLLGKVFKKGAISKPIKPGFDMPRMMAEVATPSPELTWPEAVASFRSTMARLEAGERMTKPSPVFGPMTHEEWVQLHCRHAELHLSFIQPVEPA